MITVKQASLFGLSPQEKKVLNLLAPSKKPLTATAISSLVKEPRTTINFYLRKLSLKGWVKRTKISKYPYPLWYLSEKSEIKNSIFDSLSTMGVPLDTLATTTTREGYEQVIAAYEKILEVGKTERVIVIQGSIAPSAALLNLPTEFIERIHSTQKQKRIILEGVTSNKGLSVFKNMSLRELKSHHGRLTVVHIIPDEYLNFDAEIFLFHHKAIIIQPSSSRALIIDDENTTQALNMLFNFIKEHAEKIDLNAYIKSWIDISRW